LPEMMWLLWYFSALFLHYDSRIIVWLIKLSKLLTLVQILACRYL
jgi:hypothetical protein